MISIKNKPVLIVAAGPTIKKYWNKIQKFIDDTKPITIGCNKTSYIFFFILIISLFPI